MNQPLTISCRLKVSDSQAAKLDATLEAFGQALNWVNQKTPDKIVNGVKLQSLCYYEIRACFGLSSNLAQQVCRRGAASRKIAKQKHRPVKAFKGGFVTYDARIFSFWEKDWTVLLSSVDGRERFDLATENLTGIRERTNQQPRSKAERRRSNSWAFYQLRRFITYKALRSGVKVVLVDPRYTSQTCHRCLHIHPDSDKSYRSGKQFRCGHCGWQGDADFNGAKNIAAMGALVNRPRGPWLSCQITGGLLKARVVPPRVGVG
ncbi:RNA-guided endonuclease TnpB family protein [Thermosynechococcus sp.]|uniref:RNA-guided endonuclease TnpB family protein n=1 Tax=Thermosynechococcus sp. TaxID=2814275 RepID=UPI00391B1340